ncbi:hypothetical protein [Chryseobacterium gambrini]|uniref:hypothetical protein n=1 Tax=Chryseobacterium gambrini TaxID=373672 RepID=UPI003D0AE935
MNKSLDKIKNWDAATISLLIISILIIIFSFFAPTVFTKAAIKSNLDFTGTGQIGDTLGGIMNPFIALGGVFLTFLAFYMQIKANQIQISQFNDGITNEKENKIIDEKKLSFYNLSLLIIDLDDIIDDIKHKSERIKEYIDLEKQDDLYTNYLYRTPSKKYSRVLETDRLQIYKGFIFFLFEQESWLKSYSSLYNILDYLPELFNTIYQKYENHSADLFEKKMILRGELNNLMNNFSQLINNYHSQNPLNYLNIPEVKISNNAIYSYYNIVNENVDENQKPISETDFNRINEEILKPFLEDALFIRNNNPNYDRQIEVYIESISNIRKDIQFLKNRKSEFAQSLENEYNSLIVDKDQQISILNELSIIQNDIKLAIKKIDINKL